MTLTLCTNGVTQDETCECHSTFKEPQNTVKISVIACSSTQNVETFNEHKMKLNDHCPMQGDSKSIMLMSSEISLFHLQSVKDLYK